jgi:hypothetical protein
MGRDYEMMGCTLGWPELCHGHGAARFLGNDFVLLINLEEEVTKETRERTKSRNEGKQ